MSEIHNVEVYQHQHRMPAIKTGDGTGAAQTSFHLLPPSVSLSLSHSGPVTIVSQREEQEEREENVRVKKKQHCKFSVDYVKE